MTDITTNTQLAAETVAPVSIPDGYCIMPRRLTAENGAKALLLGEFKVEVTKECPDCCELDDPNEHCQICDGEGEYGQSHTISWDQIKYIYSRAVQGLSRTGQPAVVSGAVPPGWMLVPIRPTQAMLDSVSVGANARDVVEHRAESVWQAMVQAVPSLSMVELSPRIEPFAWIGDYAACGGGRCVFTEVEAARITDAMCAKTPVFTLDTVAAARAAIKTLEAKGYTYNGGELWKPPVGAAPDFNLIDDLRTRADDVDRLVRELDVLLNGETGAAAQASLCDIVAQVRMVRQQPVDALTRYVRAPSRKDPKYHEEWPEIDGGPVFDGVTYCNDLFAALKRYNVIVAETMPEGAADE